MECIAMVQRFRRGFSAAEKTELWDRWQKGESLKAIGRAFGKPSSSIILPSSSTRRDSSGSAASLAAGIDAFGARGDIQRSCGASIGPIVGQAAGSLALDGEPRTWAQ